MGDVTKNFSYSEFQSKDKSKTPAAAKKNIRKLCKNLEIIRNELDGRSISTSSGYRSLSHNKKVGGAKSSQHLYGQAADIKVKGKRPATVYKTILHLIKEGKIEKGGCAQYRTFVHYDRRGRNARWAGSAKK